MNGNQKRALKRQYEKAELVAEILKGMVMLKVDKAYLALKCGLSIETVRKGIRNPSEISLDKLQMIKGALDECYEIKRKGI